MLDLALTLQKLKACKNKISIQEASAAASFQALIRGKLQNAEFQLQLKKLATQLELPQWQGDFGKAQQVAVRPQSYNVLAVDASQIWPDRHAIFPQVALIQVAGVVFEYAAIESKTRYFSHVEIVLAQDFVGVSFDKSLVEQLRDLLELECALAWAQELSSPPLLLMDGSLSFLLGRFARQEKTVHPAFSRRFFHALAELKQLEISTLFYTSRPSSKQFSGLLKIVQCKAVYFDRVSCTGGCAELLCAELAPMSDAQLFEFFLLAENLSQLFTTSIADIEIASWFLNTNLIDKPHSGEVAKLELLVGTAGQSAEFLAEVLDQTHKGFGYPVSLALAHHKAVISAAEQNTFEQLLVETLPSKAGKISQKLLHKSFVRF
jgi:hypothetical protein